MNIRPPLVVWLGLAVVLLAAAVLSFEELRNLALAVGISTRWAWLLPIAVDAGAAVSCSVWLGGRSSPDAAAFAGRMTWALLGTTVAGNAAQLGMASAHITPPWWCAVLVGAIPPAVVGATVHLVVLLVRRASTADTGETTSPVEEAAPDAGDEPSSVEPPVDATSGPVLRLTPRRPERRRPTSNTGLTDAEALARGRQWIATHNGRLPATRAERREATGCGGDRAERLAAQLTADARTARTGTENQR